MSDAIARTELSKPWGILVSDVWGHAYYLDRHGDRKDFVQIFLTHLANWDMALARLKSKAKL